MARCPLDIGTADVTSYAGLSCQGSQQADQCNVVGSGYLMNWNKPLGGLVRVSGSIGCFS